MDQDKIKEILFNIKDILLEVTDNGFEIQSSRVYLEMYADQTTNHAIEIYLLFPINKMEKNNIEFWSVYNRMEKYLNTEGCSVQILQFITLASSRREVVNMLIPIKTS